MGIHLLFLELTPPKYLLHQAFSFAFFMSLLTYNLKDESFPDYPKLNSTCPNPLQSMSLLIHDYIFLRNTSMTYVLFVLSDFITRLKAKNLSLIFKYVTVAPEMMLSI